MFNKKILSGLLVLVVGCMFAFNAKCMHSVILEANCKVFGKRESSKINFRRLPLEMGLYLVEVSKNARIKIPASYALPVLTELYPRGVLNRFNASDFSFLTRIVPKESSSWSSEAKGTLARDLLGAHRVHFLHLGYKVPSYVDVDEKFLKDACLFDNNLFVFNKLSDETVRDKINEAMIKNKKMFEDDNALKAPVNVSCDVFPKLLFSLFEGGMFRLYGAQERDLIFHLHPKENFFSSVSKKGRIFFAECLMGAIRSLIIAENYSTYKSRLESCEMERFLYDVVKSRINDDGVFGCIIASFRNSESGSLLFKLSAPCAFTLISKLFPDGLFHDYHKSADDRAFLLLFFLTPEENFYKLSDKERLFWMECLVGYLRSRYLSLRIEEVSTSSNRV
ncbi:MAG: hypothetical protein LBT90_03165 [Holosporaceae bacterium]|jgi:hypothetical protein|nr:hypothetical protein [Holosporaceae bacterium]